MSEEKKLTDEEIVKDLINEINRGEWCELTFIECVEVRVLKNSLDLIHRMQDDYSNLKERYVKVLGLNEKVIAEQKAEIERLKINVANEKKWGKIQANQAEKETARKIWDDCIDKIMRGCGDDKEFWVVEILSETFKKYEVGFEVDYEN